MPSRNLHAPIHRAGNLRAVDDLRPAPEFAEVLVAIRRAGAIAVPLNAKLNRNDLAHISACSGARLVFAAPDFPETAALVADAVPELDIVLVAPSA